MNIVNAFKMGNTVGESLVVNNSAALLLDSQFSTSSSESNYPIFGVPADWGRVGPYLRFSIGGENA
jgi:hypothetical protein